MSRSNYPDPVRAEWLKFGTKFVELLIVSELTRWVSHWDTKLARTRKCGGAGCQLCAWGVQKQLRVVLMGVDGAGRDKLIEIRERHRFMFDAIESPVGLVLAIRRAGSAKNSPVDLDFRGYREAALRDISALVESFGVEPLMRADWLKIEGDQRLAISEQLQELELGRNEGLEREQLRGRDVPNPVGFEGFE